MPSIVRELAIKHGLRVGYLRTENETVYWIRDPATLAIVESTRSKHATAANALAMIRRYLRRRA